MDDKPGLPITPEDLAVLSPETLTVLSTGRQDRHDADMLALLPPGLRTEMLSRRPVGYATPAGLEAFYVISLAEDEVGFDVNTAHGVVALAQLLGELDQQGVTQAAVVRGVRISFTADGKILLPPDALIPFGADRPDQVQRIDPSRIENEYLPNVSFRGLMPGAAKRFDLYGAESEQQSEDATDFDEAAVAEIGASDVDPEEDPDVRPERPSAPREVEESSDQDG